MRPHTSVATPPTQPSTNHLVLAASQPRLLGSMEASRYASLSPVFFAPRSLSHQAALSFRSRWCFSHPPTAQKPTLLSLYSQHTFTRSTHSAHSAHSDRSTPHTQPTHSTHSSHSHSTLSTLNTPPLPSTHTLNTLLRTQKSTLDPHTQHSPPHANHTPPTAHSHGTLNSNLYAHSASTLHHPGHHSLRSAHSHLRLRSPSTLNALRRLSPLTPLDTFRSLTPTRSTHPHRSHSRSPHSHSAQSALSTPSALSLLAHSLPTAHTQTRPSQHSAPNPLR
jgi:hypothetical protein